MSPVTNSGIETQLSDIPKRIVAAWAAHDAGAFADVFTEDGSMILPGDVFIKGRESIRAFMAGAFAGPYKGTQVMGEPIHLKSLTDEVALVITQGGVRPAGAAELPADQEVRATWVLVRQAGQWLLSAYQNTPVHSA